MPLWQCSTIQHQQSSSSKLNPSRPGATGGLGAAQGLLRRALGGHIPSARGAGGHQLGSRPSRSAPRSQAAPGTRRSSVLLSGTLLPLLAARGGVQRAETAGRRPQPLAPASWPGANAPPWEPDRLGCGVSAPRPRISTSQQSIPGSLYHSGEAMEGLCISLGHLEGHCIPRFLHPCCDVAGECSSCSRGL